MIQNALAPQRFRLPALRTSHSRRIHGRVLRHQCLDVAGERVLRVDGIQPVGDAAEVRVEALSAYRYGVNPWKRHPFLWQHRGERKTLIPKSGVVGTIVPNNSKTFHPTTQKLVGRNLEIVRDMLLYFWITSVLVEFGKSAERCHFQGLPCGRHIRNIVFVKVFLDETFVRAIDFCSQPFKILLEQDWFVCQRLIQKPKWAILHRKMIGDFCTHSYFQFLDGREYAHLQFCIEFVEQNHIFKVALWLENMPCFICFHNAPIFGQTEIANKPQQSLRLCRVFNNKPSLSQDLNLLSEGQSLLSIFHRNIKKTARRVALPLRGRVPGSLAAKVQTFSETSKYFERNLSKRLKKNNRRINTIIK